MQQRRSQLKFEILSPGSKTVREDSFMNGVDVIVPCYRYGHFLHECVESVLQQAGPAVRVLIIDDASPDNTAEVASELESRDSRVMFARHAKNRGHIATYNEGIDWAASEYVLLLSADDYLLPGALRRAADLMDRNPKMAFMFGNARVLNERGDTKLTRSIFCPNDDRLLTGAEFIALSGPRNIVSTPTAMVRTSLQKKLGGYRPELPHSGDMEMWLRLAAHGDVGFIATAQAVYRRHESNMSLGYSRENLFRDLEQRKAALDCFFESCGSVLTRPEQLSRELLRALSCDAIDLASSAFNDGQTQASKQLSDYAVQIFPAIRRSTSWSKLVCKRMLGYTAWRALDPLVNALRPIFKGDNKPRPDAGNSADSSGSHGSLQRTGGIEGGDKRTSRLETNASFAVGSQAFPVIARREFASGDGGRSDD